MEEEKTTVSLYLFQDLKALLALLKRYPSIAIPFSVSTLYSSFVSSVEKSLNNKQTKKGCKVRVQLDTTNIISAHKKLFWHQENYTHLHELHNESLFLFHSRTFMYYFM